jgi:hypothetical protein
MVMYRFASKWHALSDVLCSPARVPPTFSDAKMEQSMACAAHLLQVEGAAAPPQPGVGHDLPHHGRHQGVGGWKPKDGPLISSHQAHEVHRKIVFPAIITTCGACTTVVLALEHDPMSKVPLATLPPAPQRCCSLLTWTSFGTFLCLAQVRRAAAGLARSARGVTLRLCDPSLSSPAGKCAGNATQLSGLLNTSRHLEQLLIND